MPSMTKTRDVTAEIAFLTRALKASTLRDAVDRLAERARAESWTHEFCLDPQSTPTRAMQTQAGIGTPQFGSWTCRNAS